jgi:hypothetical protein
MDGPIGRLGLYEEVIMTHIPEVAPLTSLTAPAMLMAVLDVIESPAMTEAVQEAGGINRKDGVRRSGWELRFKLAHMLPDSGTWMEELDHAVTHAQAAGSMTELQGALRVVAAISASWALALEIRAQGDDA